MKDDWALIVGINSYPLASGIPPLGGAVRDSMKFLEWVKDPKGGDIPEADGHICHLTSPEVTPKSARPRPVFSEIVKFFEEMLFQLGNDPGRRLYIYLSGHGISPVNQAAIRNAALLMADTRPPALYPSFTANLWAETIRSSALFREVVLVMDCCRDLNNEAPVVTPTFGNPTADSRDCRMMVAYAARCFSRAREAELGPNQEKHGLFTYSLLEVLKAGKMDGRLLKESVRAHMKTVAKQTNFQLGDPEIGEDDFLNKFIFNEAADPPQTPVTLRNHPAAQPVITSGEPGQPLVRANLDSWNFDGTGWRGSLTPGLYLLQVNGTPGTWLQVFAGVPLEVTL